MAEQTLTVSEPELKSIMATAVDAAQAGGVSAGPTGVEVNLLDKVTVEAKARNFRLILDEPPSFGGGDAGPNPEEVLHGNADFSGFYGLAEDPPIGFDRVRCEVTIEADATEERLREFEQMVEDRCVGHGTLRRPVPVETTCGIRGTADATASADGDGTPG